MTFCLCYQILKNLHYKNLEEFRKNEAHYILNVVPGTLFLEQKLDSWKENSHSSTAIFIFKIRCFRINKKKTIR